MFPTTEEEEILQNPFYSDTKTKDTEKNYRPISLKNIDAKILKKKILANRINSISNRLYAMTKWDAFLECKDGST